LVLLDRPKLVRAISMLFVSRAIKASGENILSTAAAAADNDPEKQRQPSHLERRKGAYHQVPNGLFRRRETVPELGIRCTDDMQGRIFPLPDGPIMATASPSDNRNEIPERTWSGPRGVG
jgi:hypothetical protein